MVMFCKSQAQILGITKVSGLGKSMKFALFFFFKFVGLG